MGHPQPTTPMNTENCTVDSVVSNKVQQKHTKAMDMCFYWVQYRILQGDYNVFLELGATNLSDYFTKHHPPHHHRQMIPVYLYCPGNWNNSSARVCYSSHIPRQKRDWCRSQISKEDHLQTIKPGKQGQTCGHMDRLTGENNIQQLKSIEGPTAI